VNLGCSTRADFGPVGSGVAGEPEPAPGVLGGDRGQCGPESGLELVEAPRRLGPETALQLRPAGLDRVQVGRVGRQVAVRDAGGVQRRPDPLGLVRGQVVHHHDRVRPLPQGGNEHLLDEGEEDARAGRGGDAHRGDHPVEGQGAEHGEPLPMAPGHRARGPAPPWGAAVGPGHPGVDAALIQEHQAPRLDPGQLGPPRGAGLGQLGPVPLRGPQRLFCA
jgi:hypothetical protein